MIIEVVGPSGVGKSALAAEFAKRGAILPPRSIHASSRLTLACSVAKTAPVLATQYRYLRAGAWQRFTQMVSIDVLRHAVEEVRTPEHSTPIILDQGPVYRLTVIRRALNQPPARNSSWFSSYWTSLVKYWSRTLDVVILLDADDETLRKRLIQRSGAESANRRDEARFLQTPKLIAERNAVIDCLRSDGLKVQEISTTNRTVDETADECIDLLQPANALVPA